MNLNKVIIAGRLGADPEAKTTQNGSASVKLSVATNYSYKDTAGELVEKTTWHKINAFGQPATFAAEFLKKGDTVLVEGKLDTYSFEKDGETVNMLTIKADSIQSIPPSRKE